jgi:NADH:ubiquinone reductase (H+-translocating)
MTPSRETDGDGPTVVIVGGGFAGVGAAKELAEHSIKTVLIDKNNYHQFQPLLYQVATAGISADNVATPLRELFRKDKTIDVKQGEVVSVDPETRTVTTASGETYTGDYLVLATGSQPNYFRTPGAEEYAFPLYSLRDAERLRSRILEVFDAADRNPALVDKGALNFVIVGGGATGVEIAGALADFINEVLPEQYRDLAIQSTRVHIVDHGSELLAPFSEKAHEYVAKVLSRAGVHMKLGRAVKEITASSATLDDGTVIPTRCVIWAGGLKASDVAGLSGLKQGRGGRITIEHDLTVEGYPQVYVLGDVANSLAPDGTPFPQLGSVALQHGIWAAKNIRKHIDGKALAGFHYHDKGIMAMIGRGAAIAEVGPHRHELHGSIAFAAWLGVHAWLMNGIRTQREAITSWGWDYFSSNRKAGLIDNPNAATINWDDDDGEEAAKPADSDVSTA